MLRDERINLIIRQLEENGSVRVLELMEQFHVSDMTIRRDLRVLEEKGVVERIHGGALLSKTWRSNINPHIIERINHMAEEKKRMGEKVVELVAEGETIFLGSGTTTIYAARELFTRDDITVITNSVPILNELANSATMKVITVGGYLRRGELSLIGVFAEAVLEGIRANKVIVGMPAIHPQYGFTCEHPEELMTDRKIFGISDEIIVIADHTKIGQVATNKIAAIDQAKSIITGSKAREEIIENIRAKGVEVLLV